MKQFGQTPILRFKITTEKVTQKTQNITYCTQHYLNIVDM